MAEVYKLISMVPHPCLLNIKNDHSQSALHLAVITKQSQVVRRLVLAGADLMTTGRRGDTPLHLACESGDMSCALALTSQVTRDEYTSSLVSARRFPEIPQDLEKKNRMGKFANSNLK